MPDYWIQTYTGKRLSLTRPRPEEIDIEDVAHSLSLQCRFNGHTKQFYSVAQHSVFVARKCRLQDAAIMALLHDAHELATGDIVRPLKAALILEVKRIERELDRAIVQALVADPTLRDAFVRATPYWWRIERAIGEADVLALATERRDLLAPGPPWEMKLPEPDPLPLHPLPSAAAKELFLETYYELNVIQQEGTAA